MLLHIVAHGKIGRSPEAELVERYLKRIQWPSRLTELPDRGGKLPDLPANSVRILNCLFFVDLTDAFIDQEGHTQPADESGNPIPTTNKIVSRLWSPILVNTRHRK